MAFPVDEQQAARIAELQRQLHQAAAALEERDALLRAFFEQSPLMNAVVEWQDPDFRYLTINGSAATLLQRTPRQIEGQWASELGVPPEKLELWSEIFARIASSGVPGQTEFSSAGRHFVSTLVPLPIARGQLPRFSFSSQEVTREREAKAALVIAERRATVGRTAASVAHEIKNPLGFISANARFVVDELGSATAAVEPDVLAAMTEIVDGVDRVHLLVRGLLELGRPRAEAKLSTIDVSTCVRRALGLVRLEVRAIAELREQVGPVPGVVADPNHLEQALLNLLLNAVDAMREVRGRAHVLTVRLFLDAGRVVIEVEDSGPGIPKEHQPVLFDAYFSTKQDRGTGLGLAITREIVTSFGGTIAVRSELGAGSVFRIDLPVAAAGAP